MDRNLTLPQPLIISTLPAVKQLYIIEIAFVQLYVALTGCELSRGRKRQIDSERGRERERHWEEFQFLLAQFARN